MSVHLEGESLGELAGFFGAGTLVHPRRMGGFVRV